jgi:phosphate transport system substrate-binding protein
MKLSTHAGRSLAGCLAVAGMVWGAAGVQAVDISGAGATFPYPIYAQWAYAYNKVSGVKLNYQSIGSGGGIAQITAKTVDFGASDLPLTPDKLEQIGLIQWPMVVGGVVPVVHISGVKAGDIKLTAALLADIYLGKIVKWSDPALKQVNPGVSLPDRLISVVRRSDGSGTTAIFTDYLAKVSAQWKKDVGSSTSVKWPAGLGGKGNEGVAAYVQQIDASIGYVELAYALQNKMSWVQMENKSGKWVSPSLESFAAAADHADWSKAPGFYLMLTDQPGDDTWPISGATFILFHKQQASADTALEVLKFFDWCYQNGAATAKKLDYVPIPANVTKVVRESWAKNVRAGGKPVWR